MTYQIMKGWSPSCALRISSLRKRRRKRRMTYQIVDGWTPTRAKAFHALRDGILAKPTQTPFRTHVSPASDPIGGYRWRVEWLSLADHPSPDREGVV